MLPYKDRCEISGNEVVDNVTGEISRETLYSGLCDFQSASANIVEGVTMAQSPRLYIPYSGNLLGLELNQTVKITLSVGRIIKATILDFQYIDFGKLKGIKINLNETTY